MKDVPIILLGFGNVGQSLVKLLADNDGYAREGVRLTLHSVFDRKGGIVATGHEMSALVDAKRRKGSVSLLDGGQRIELANLSSALGDALGGILVDSSITNAETGEPGFTAARSALERGLSVVFASKGPLVARYRELSELHPERFVRGTPQPPVLLLQVWINPPPEKTTLQDAAGATLAAWPIPGVPPFSASHNEISIEADADRADVTSLPTLIEAH